jgi:L-lactate dehydrogenase complex protein LldE
MRIALFVTCLVDTLSPAVGRATVEVLERLGHEVTFPQEQTCCGQMHANTGYADEATALARRFVRIFGAGDHDAIVCPSPSCVGMVREQFGVLARAAGDEPLAAAAAELAPRVHDLSELLVDRLGVEDVGATFPYRVAYHPTCHGLRGLGLGDRPVRLLRAVRELELVELADATTCCGFGGTFAIKNADVSAAMLSDKIGGVLASGADVLCAGDASCLLHIDGGLRHGRTGVRTIHLAEILVST